jgi:hypothetical protein
LAKKLFEEPSFRRNDAFGFSVKRRSANLPGTSILKRIFEPTEKFVLSQRWHFAQFVQTGKFAPSRSLKNSPVSLVAGVDQGCQMIFFLTKNPNLDQFLGVLQRKMLAFGKFCGLLVYF